MDENEFQAIWEDAMETAAERARLYEAYGDPTLPFPVFSAAVEVIEYMQDNAETFIYSVRLFLSGGGLDGKSNPDTEGNHKRGREDGVSAGDIQEVRSGSEGDKD